MEQSFPTVPDLIISETGILKLQMVNPNKASGPDNIRPKVLKELISNIIPMLYFIFGVSLDAGVVPLDLRCANVSPVYKKVEKYIAENYMPILVYLTYICCKLMEHNYSDRPDDELCRQKQHTLPPPLCLLNQDLLLLRTPGPVPFGTCICSNVETILS